MWGQKLFQTWGSLNREQPVTKALPFPSCTTKIFSPSTWTGRKSAGWSYTGRRRGKQALSVSLNCNPCKIKFSSLSSISLCLSVCVSLSLFILSEVLYYYLLSRLTWQQKGHNLQLLLTTRSNTLNKAHNQLCYPPKWTSLLTLCFVQYAI